MSLEPFPRALVAQSQFPFGSILATKMSGWLLLETSVVEPKVLVRLNCPAT
jgi:hypothetical protein